VKHIGNDPGWVGENVLVLDCEYRIRPLRHTRVDLPGESPRTTRETTKEKKAFRGELAGRQDSFEAPALPSPSIPGEDGELKNAAEQLIRARGEALQALPLSPEEKTLAFSALTRIAAREKNVNTTVDRVIDLLGSEAFAGWNPIMRRAALGSLGACERMNDILRVVDLIVGIVGDEQPLGLSPQEAGRILSRTTTLNVSEQIAFVSGLCSPAFPRLGASERRALLERPLLGIVVDAFSIATDLSAENMAAVFELYAEAPRRSVLENLPGFEALSTSQRTQYAAMLTLPSHLDIRWAIADLMRQEAYLAAACDERVERIRSLITDPAAYPFAMVFPAKPVGEYELKRKLSVARRRRYDLTIRGDLTKLVVPNATQSQRGWPNETQMAQGLTQVPGLGRASIEVLRTSTRGPRGAWMSASSFGLVRIHRNSVETKPNEFVSALSHESGHTFPLAQYPQGMSSFWREYRAAERADVLPISTYAKTNHTESMAELWVLYWNTVDTRWEAAARAAFPNRFAFLDRYMKRRVAEARETTVAY
jgi:hypothetical protein